VSEASPSFAVGDELAGEVVTGVDPRDIWLFALILRDPNPIHYDVETVRASGLGDREVNQGGATLAYVLNTLVSAGGSRAAVESLTCRFTANVFADDDVTTGATVTAVEPGAVECDVWARVEDRTVITGSARLRT
jgi:acyl dehydratase